MKPQQNILIIVLNLLIFSLYGQVSSKDTVFIKKDSVYGTAQSIYFENNSNSQFYDAINYWGFLPYDQESYTYSINYLKENKELLTKKPPVIPFTKWVLLEQYKGKFYAYHPCDFLSHLRVSINDTTFIDWTGEGPVANKIIDQKKINELTYEFKLTGYDKDRKLVIHIIDKKKGIAVFEETKNGGNFYYLMIMSDKIRSVPLIVNNCEKEKQIELVLETPNYIAILKSGK